jgi:phosphoenolpyruvate synthase/pyruvate phosphate dikinase
MISSLTKARTLEYLSLELSEFIVPKTLSFTTSEFKKNENLICVKVQRLFNGESIIVRSSAVDEDGGVSTLAGEYDSVLNVPSNNLNLISDAVNTVISSYNKKGVRYQDDEILVQEMISDVSMSGVIFTHDINTGAPYYVINYDDISGLTDTVTSGGGEYANRTLYVFREKVGQLSSERFQKLLSAVKELERITKSKFLDIEFALSKDLVPYLLQVRSITSQSQWNSDVSDGKVKSALIDIENTLRKNLQRADGVFGNTTVFGQMPDWNPAEIIGRVPRALALSLYKKLITDDTWRLARKIMGYSTPASKPLLVSLSGQPFIDTRLSFHSYLPSGLSSNVSEKLVDKWVEHLKMNPELHDKVEFDVAITTYSFDIDQKFQDLVGDTLTDSEKDDFKRALHKQTKKLLIGDGEYGISKALQKIDHLAEKNTNIDIANISNLSALYAEIDDCIKLGTIPFAILARHGFIARALLMSLHKKGILSITDVNNLLFNVQTVASEFVEDIELLQLGDISREYFMKKYGHLRPGTYDILSHRYDQMDGLMTNNNPEPKKPSAKFKLSTQKMQQIDKLLQSENFSEINAEKLMKYISSAIKGREYSKFIFTRSISNILEQIAEFGEHHEISREELSNIPIDTLLEVAINSSKENVKGLLQNIYKYEKEKHTVSVAVRLPQVLSDMSGVYIVPFQVSCPNFITHQKVIASCVVLSSRDGASSLNGKIVIIENADPGFDWIFSQKISGLITKYGGVNSHMAIRCAEFGIPAAIGCGEQRFEAILGSNKILLDCATGLVHPLH